MLRNIKLLSAGVAALFALGALVSTAAYATEWTAKEYPVRLVGNQNGTNKISIGANSPIECESIESASAEPEFLSKAFISLLGNLLFRRCRGYGFLELIATGLKGALFLLTWTGTRLILAFKQTAGTTGGVYTFRVPAIECEVTFPTGQEFTEGASAANISGGKVEVTLAIKKVKYTSNEKGLGCPKNGEEASITGKEIVEGFNELKAADSIEVK